MKDYFNRLCIYYLNGFNKNYYKKIIKSAKQDKVDVDKIDKDAKKYTDILKKKLREFNYRGYKKEAYEMINKYIKIKDDMDESDKKIYLEILNSLCKIYKIDLRNELKDYVTELMKPEDVFKELFKCYLEDKDVEDLEKIRVKCKSIYFMDVDEKASQMAKNINKFCKKYNYSFVNEDSIYESIDKYLSNKNKYSKVEKSEILRNLAMVARVYDIDIKQEIESKYKELNKEDNIIKELLNPLDNDSFLLSYLYQRYSNCIFNIRELPLPNYYNSNSSKDDDYINYQARLMKRIILIYLDKINNYGIEDINPLYINILSVEDMSRLDDIEEKDLISFIGYINKKIEEGIVLRKLELSDVLYHFLVFLVSITDIYNPYVGASSKNMFVVSEKEDNIAIYIGTNNDENTFTFLSKYIIKCIENNISYNMINYLDNSISREKTILLANTDDLYIKISILDEIEREDNTIISNFDKPIVSSALFKEKYYGLSIFKIDGIEYNDFLDKVAEVAYYRLLAKLEINKVSDADSIDILNSIIKLDNVVGSNPLEATYNSYSFSTIKDMVNKNIVEVSDSLDYYMGSSDKAMELVGELRKSIRYIINICRGYNKSINSNIALFKEDIM